MKDRKIEDAVGGGKASFHLHVGKGQSVCAHEISLIAFWMLEGRFRPR